MPIYRFRCAGHGEFESYRAMADSSLAEHCPQCGQAAMRVFCMPIVKVVNKEWRKYGTGSPGKMILGKDTGGLDIFIPSDGALEQEEVDYIAEGAIEKERERVKKAKGTVQRESQARVQAYTQLLRNTPKGQRARTIREAVKQAGDKIQV